MGTFIKNFFVSVLPSFINRAVSFILGQDTASEAAKDVSYGVAKDAAVALGAMAAKAAVGRVIPGGNVAVHAVGGLVGNGLDATLNGSDNIAVTLVKGAAGAAAAALVGPVLAIPAIIAADCLVDGAINVGQKLCNFAYDKYQQTSAQPKLAQVLPANRNYKLTVAPAA